MELCVLSSNPNVKPEELNTIISEIVALHANMDNAHLPCDNYVCI